MLDDLTSINTNDFNVRINDLWKNKWFLLTSGDFAGNHFNTMTVAWGFFGIMWNKPMALVVVRPTRFTYAFMEKYDSFTLCAFDKKYHKDLLLLGTRSGRDGDKIAETKLTPGASEKVTSPSFLEAELIIECKKSYRHDFSPDQFIDESIDKNYPQKDYHRVYCGEILNIKGLKEYSA
jgi:flavin reductase (DIM6/NTAB) family NADH-FMN oxidoreductase RutF